MLPPSPLPPSTLSPAPMLLPSTADAAKDIEGIGKLLDDGGKLALGVFFMLKTPAKRWPATEAVRAALLTVAPANPAHQGLRSNRANHCRTCTIIYHFYMYDCVAMRGACVTGRRRVLFPQTAPAQSRSMTRPGECPPDLQQLLAACLKAFDCIAQNSRRV